MKITLLGSGDAIGMPVPMFNCEYCQESEKRRRPSLLVETEDVTLVFEMSPEIKEQLHEVEVFDVEGFFITHHHFDHFSGIRELNHIAIEEHVLNLEDFDYNGWHGREITVYGNQTTQKHLQEKQSHIAENENINFQTMSAGETVELGDVTVEAFRVEHGAESHGYTEEIEENIKQADADRTILVNISEHLNQIHTEEMEEAAEKKGYEVWSDFETLEM